MGRGPTATSDEIERWRAAYERGTSLAEIARQTGRHYNTIRNRVLALDNAQNLKRSSLRRSGLKPKQFSPIVTGAEARNESGKRALRDFAYFRRRYFGRLATPWQEEAAYKVLELLQTPHKEFLVVNAPPGSGKSTLFTHDIPAWLTVRNRALRGMMGSASHSLAKRYTLALRSTLENPFPVQAEPEEVRRGLSVDAEAVLGQDYGRFRPEGVAAMWATDAFIVEQEGGVPLTHKEPTWSAYGPDSAFIGGRYDIVVWDDLVDLKTVAKLETIEAQRKMWDSVAEKRLEPGGLLVLQGQRLTSEDLYRYNLNKEDGDPDRSHEMCCHAERGRKYHHIVFRAHYEDRCSDDHSTEAEFYPKGCLLDPRRLTWRDLSAEMQTDTFLTVYQQEDANPSEMLVNPLWVKGGTDPYSKEYFPGCWDDDRGLCELPRGVPRPVLSIATTDPSPTRFWANQWWCITPDKGIRFFMDQERRTMQLPDFLSWAGGTYGGLMEEWWQRSKELGVVITHWIIEANAAQRFILQIPEVKQWASSRGVQLIAHQTTLRKNDPAYGPKVLADLYRFGRVRLPGKQQSLDNGRTKALKLVEEVTHWPKSSYDDCVMAQWFVEANLPNISHRKTTAAASRRPSWMKKAS